MSNFFTSFLFITFFICLRENFADQQNLCHDRIRFNGKQTKSSIFCSSCATFLHGGISSPMIQFELPNLTKLTGIFVRKQNENQTKISKKSSYFIEYRRTQDGPWRPFGKRQQRQLVVERTRLFLNSDQTRTNLPSLIVRQIRLIFFSSSNPNCVFVEFYGCSSRDGLISSRLPQRSIINPDLKYDGWISETTARGGLGILTDGDTSKYLHWSSILNEPIFLLFAFDSIKEFRSIDLDLKCSNRRSTSCTIEIQIGIFELIKETNRWTNRFRSITINNNQSDDQTTLTHLILSVSQSKGQFVIIQILTNDDLALSEVTFDNRNEFDIDQQDNSPSSIYIENNLRRLESIAFKLTNEITKTNQKFFNFIIFLLLIFVILILVGLSLWIFSRRIDKSDPLTPKEFDESVTTSLTTTPNGVDLRPADSDVYSDVEPNPPEFISTCLKPISSHTIVNESAKATIRALTSFRDSMISHNSIGTFHFLDEHLNEIDASEIVILENLGTQLNRQCFLSEFADEKTSVILHENDQDNERNDYFTLSKLINHSNLVKCFGFVNVSPERCFLVHEHSRTNLLDFCRTLSNEDEKILTNLMKIVDDIVSALVHLESLKMIICDLTMPNCLLITNKDQSLTIKLSDYAKYDDRYASRYVQRMPIRWLPGDLVIGDENWSIHINSFMFGTLLFELFHLASVIPYKDLSDEQVLEFYRRTWSHSKDNSMEPSVLCLTTYFPRPILCHDRLYALMERCLSWSSTDRPSFREISLCLNETTTVICE